MNKQILGMHDWSPEWGKILLEQRVGGWCCVTEALGCDPTDQRGQSYVELGNHGVEPIVRLNNAYGQGYGTIPKPRDHQNFAQRCANFVRASQGCTHWIIGNETNMPWESPYSSEEGNALISAHEYAACFKFCHAAIKRVQPDAIIMPAPVAPWNAHQGDWIDLQRTIWDACWPFEAVAIHTYSHGHDPALIESEAMMDPPFNNRHYHFRTYRDFMAAIPQQARSLAVHITESNPDGWEDKNNGWIVAAVREIDGWNRTANNQQIHSLSLYRWPQHDRAKFAICTMPNVIEDFRSAVGQNVQVQVYKPQPPAPSMAPTPPLQPAIPNPAPAPAKGPRLTAVLESIDIEDHTESYEAVTVVNVRSAPNIKAPIVNQLMTGQVVTAFRKSGDWICSDLGWSASVWNEYPLLLQIKTDNWSRSIRHVMKWEGGYHNGTINGAIDPGGETNYGISKRSYPHLDIKSLTSDQAIEIYRRDYWMNSGANDLPWPICLTHFDFAVNAGTWRAKRTLEKSGGNFERYNELREEFYRNIPSFIHFGRAWLRRVGDVVSQVGGAISELERPE